MTSPTPVLSSFMSSSQPINYARVEGIQHQELGAAILFAILYIPCIPIFLYFSFKRYTFVWRSLVLFALGRCPLYRNVDQELTIVSVRSTAFIMRALLSGSSTAGENYDTVIAESIIYSLGFYGLLYSAYTLALDR